MNDVSLRTNETFAPGGIGAAPVPSMDGYRIVAVSPWVLGNWSDAYALINYHGYLSGCSVSCKNLDSAAHEWSYGAVVLYEKI